MTSRLKQRDDDANALGLGARPLDAPPNIDGRSIDDDQPIKRAVDRPPVPPLCAPPAQSGKRRLSVVREDGVRAIDSDLVVGGALNEKFRPFVVPRAVSGLPREMTVLLGERRQDLLKLAFHGDQETFCPPRWGDLAIGSGACGFGCRSCFLMLTHRALRDPMHPVIYTNGDDFERVVARWLKADDWLIETVRAGETQRVRHRRSAQDSLGLGIDCADSLLFEGVTGHARRLIPLFTDPLGNRHGNPLILLTKSANTHYLGEIAAAALRRDVLGRVPNVAVTMSLNPERIADLWEGKFPDTMERITPPIDRRLAALREAQDMGFEVRARIDPIFTPPGWEDDYRAFFADMAHRHGLRPTMLTLGTYREKNNQLATWNKKWGLPAMEFEPEKTSGRDGTHVHQAERAEIYRTVHGIIDTAFRGTGFMPKVSLCKETHEVRKQVDLCNANCNCLTGKLGGNETRRHLPIVR